MNNVLIFLLGAFSGFIGGAIGAVLTLIYINSKNT